MLNQNNEDQILDSDKTSSGSASKGNSATNSGESMAQGPDKIVNEQEQNKSVNQEEFIDANTEFTNSNKDGLPAKNKENQKAPEVKGDTDDSEQENPTMKAK